MKGSIALFAKPHKGNGQLIVRRPELLDGFRAKVFKCNIRGEDCKAQGQLADILLIGCW